MNQDGNVSFVRRAAQFTSVGDEKEAFYLRVYGAGQYRYYGADLGILVTHGRFQTDHRQLIDRAKLWNAGIKAQFHGIAPHLTRRRCRHRRGGGRCSRPSTLGPQRAALGCKRKPLPAEGKGGV